jgi:hypothetical protein
VGERERSPIASPYHVDKQRCCNTAGIARSKWRAASAYPHKLEPDIAGSPSEKTLNPVKLGFRCAAQIHGVGNLPDFHCLLDIPEPYAIIGDKLRLDRWAESETPSSFRSSDLAATSPY